MDTNKTDVMNHFLNDYAVLKILSKYCGG